MKWVVALFWIVLVGLGYLRLPAAKPAAPAPPKPSACLAGKDKAVLPHFIARRVLPVNHRIGERDLDWTAGSGSPARRDFEGAYLACAAAPGDPVIQKELEPKPELKSASGKAPHHLPISAADAGSVNAGYQVDVVVEGKAVLRQTPVLATECGPAPGCVAILDLTPVETALLARFDGKPATLAIRKRPEVK